MNKSREVDMIHGPLLGRMVFFAMPLAVSSILQHLFNSADVAVVGRFAGSDALAAAGSCSALVGIFVNLIIGLAVGPNACLARLIGERRRDEISGMVHTTVTFGGLLGLALMAAGMLAARPILVLSATPERILPQAMTYILIYFAGLPFITLFNFGAAVLRSVGDTKRPMYCLLLSGAVNVALNLVFVIAFHWGVAGVAAATTLSNLLACGMVLAFLRGMEGEFTLRARRLRVEKAHLVRILRVGVPAGLQGGVFSFSNLFIQSGINTFGADAIAGASVGLNFEYFTYDIVTAFAQAVITFTGQNYGAGDLKRCRRVFLTGMGCAFLITEALSLIFLARLDLFVGLYTSSAEVARYAVLRFMRVALWEGFTASYEISAAALRGLGRSAVPAILTVIGTVVFRPVWLMTVFRAWPRYETIMDVYIVSWLFTGAMVTCAYLRHMKRLEREMADRQ